jgi:hypothetical protein
MKVIKINVFDMFRNNTVFFLKGNQIRFVAYAFQDPPLNNSNCETEDCRAIMLYLEYKSVCSFLRIGSPCPLSRKRVCTSHPLWSQRGNNTPLR